MEPNLRIVPSTDGAFREHVERITAAGTFRTADELAARLHTLFPRVVVRASEVSGRSDIWYVYRDGVWRPSGDRWWEDARSPRVTATPEGWIEEANAPARALLGLTASDQLPRHFTDFAVPGTLQDATQLFGIVADGHDLVATVLIRPASAEIIACDLRAWSKGDRVISALRLAEDIPVQPRVHPETVTELVCHPATDTLFARYADEALARMPEPTPDGLALRLRRLYPHARVEGGDGTWIAFRDAPDTDAAVDQWWRDHGLARVRYDGQGRIVEANEAAEALLGPRLVGRHWQELVTAGTTDEVGAVMRMIAEAGWAVSRFRLPTPDGYLFEFDSYTEVVDDAFITIMRPRPMSQAGRDLPAGG